MTQSAQPPAPKPAPRPGGGRPVRRVVSLVPSLTEAIAATDPELLVGVTDWCTHPPELGAARIRGTKNPDVPGVIALRPDLVIANEEENRPADLAALRAAGLTVLVTEIRTLDQAFRELHRVLVRGCRLPPPEWLAEAEDAWAGESRAFDLTAVIPVWRKPWMVLGRDTFAGDLLARLGVRNTHARHEDRYPRLPLADLTPPGTDLVILPDEPYTFTTRDGPEAFPALPHTLVSGRHLTWYGPSLTEAARVLRDAVAASGAGSR